MNSDSLPAAAFIAAAAAILRLTSSIPLSMWSPEFQARAIEDAKGVLSEAAPFMLAEAWDEGWDAAAGWPQIDENPYRSN